MKLNGWDHALKVTATGEGLVGHAGAILLRKAADVTGLTSLLSGALEEKGKSPLLDRGTVLVLTAAAIALGVRHPRSEHDALLGLPASAEGVPPGMAPWRLPRYIGLGRTLRLAILGEQIDATEALRIGLADHVVPAGRFAEHAAAVVERYQRVPQAAARATKELARSSFDTDFATAYARSRELVQQCLDTADVADAQAAWLRRHQ